MKWLIACTKLPMNEALPFVANANLHIFANKVINNAIYQNLRLTYFVLNGLGEYTQRVLFDNT